MMPMHVSPTPPTMYTYAAPVDISAGGPATENSMATTVNYQGYNQGYNQGYAPIANGMSEHPMGKKEDD